MGDRAASVRWDPEKYLQYASERGRPFADLLARVQHRNPRSVVDLGCGPGNLTALLKDRWPQASVLGVDSSVEMIEQARATVAGVDFEVGDLRDWTTSAPVDVLISNATLQWVPDHLQVLPELAGHVAAGGVFAFQVPGNFGAPSHVILRGLAGEPPYAEFTQGLERAAAHDPDEYLDRLAEFGEVDAWETTYSHVLAGDDAVFEWLAGTGARPYLQALPDELRPEFDAELRARLRARYPQRDYGTVLGYRRIFVVLSRPGEQ